MRHIHRLIIAATLLVSCNVFAWDVFIDGVDWRITETDDWAYVNSETLPQQTIAYQTIDFSYTPGFRIGTIYRSTWDALLSYTRVYATANESAVGNIQPAFLGSVNAKPSTSYLYQSGQVRQTVDYNIVDLNVGKQFHLAGAFMVHPIVGLMGGWINQAFYASYQGSTSSQEKIVNNFAGLGPKAGMDITIGLYHYHDDEVSLIGTFAASYLLGHWNVSDVTTVVPPQTIVIDGISRSMGALTLQGGMGFQVQHKNIAIKLVYEINDWFDQAQFFDNDTGAHNNDLILQGLTLGISC